MFGQSGNNSFGLNPTQQSSPFGQSTFGKTIATTFGINAPPAFGSNSTSLFNKPAGSTATGFFGQTTTTSAFGAPSTAAQSTFGGFGNTAPAQTMFGQQQNANTNIFGSTNPVSTAFGQQNKPVSFGFGQTTGTSLFGQPQQTAQATPFGQTTNTAGSALFGSTTGFGNTTAVAGISGTVVKFTPVTGTDTMMKNGVTQTISTRHHCITCMKEYETKSLEELRLEDYTAGRKGQSGGMFGATPQASPFSGGVVSNAGPTNTAFGGMTTGFGATSQTATTGLFSKPLTGFGAPTTTTSAFTFNNTANTTSNIFNTQAKPFGATTATPLFSTSNTGTTQNTTFGGIGTQNTGFGATGFGATQQQNQSIGLFNQNKPTFNLPASTASSTFGFGQTSQANTGGLFGAKPIGTGFGTTGFGTTSTSAFGQTAATPFGATQNTNTSLFNSSFKPAGQTTAFSFGNTPAASTGLGNTGTGLFAATSKPSLFNTTGTGSTFNTTGTFGTLSNFGTNTNNMSTMGTNLFGQGIGTTNQQQNTGSIPVHQQILALVSAPFGDSPLLKNLLPASGKSEQMAKSSSSVPKAVNSPQYKVSVNNNGSKLKPKYVASVPLSKKSLFDGLDEEDPLVEAFQPRPNAKRLVLRPKANSLGELNDKVVPTERSNHDLNESLSKTTDKENEIQEFNNRQAIDRLSSNSWLKSSLPRQPKVTEESNSPQTSAATPKSSAAADELENTMAEMRSPAHTQLPIINDSLSKTIAESDLSADRSNLDLSLMPDNRSTSEMEETNVQGEQPITNEANIRLHRHGYYTIPALEEIGNYVKDNTCIVPHFTIGRKGYGNVHFPDSFDVYGLNLDEIVHFRYKEVIIYPDDNAKPPVGQGLNRKAQVTLDRVWPIDKTTHEPISDPERLIEMDYEAKLRRVSAKHGTRFLEYRPETGSWVFKVDHFSKYGLSDSDDDEPKVEGAKALKPPQQPWLRKGYEKTFKGPEGLDFPKDMPYPTSPLPTSLNNKAAAYNFHLRSEEVNMSETQTTWSPTSVNARLLGTESHTLQLMKASFFDMSEDQFLQDAIQETQNQLKKRCKIIEPEKVMSMSQDNLIEHFLDSTTETSRIADRSLDVREISSKKLLLDATPMDVQSTKTGELTAKELKGYMPPPIVHPEVAVVRFKPGDVLFRRTPIMRMRHRMIADMGVQMGKTFRPTWGPEMTLLSIDMKRGGEDSQPMEDNQDTFMSELYFDGLYATNMVQRLQILSGSPLENDYVQMFKASIEGHLDIQLNYSIVEDHPDCPFAIAVSGESSVSALHDHGSESLKVAKFFETDQTINYFCAVWKLCEALWGKLPGKEQHIVNSADHEVTMLRKEALSDWLKFATAETVKDEISSMDSNDEIILSLLSANNLEEACKRALKNGDHCLALAMSQLSGSAPVRELLKQQIKLWQDTAVDLNMAVNRLKLFMLFAGIPVTTVEKATVNVCEDLDWKRALAVHLWYLCEPTASITDVLETYEASFGDGDDDETAYSLPPRPEYFKSEFETELSSGRAMYDLCFLLLKLYCSGNYPLETILNPQSYTHDPMDYRVSWLLQQQLSALGYTYLSNHVQALIHSNFAAQLETYDLWHWSIFVVLHLEDAQQRRKAVNDLLLRHVELDNSKDYDEREQFLQEKLKVPATWICEAKGIKASAMKRYDEAAWYFIHARNWNTAHDIIFEHLAADAIINEEHEYLKKLLSLMINSEGCNVISGWSNQGQLLWDYMTVTTEIKSILEEKNCADLSYKLELLQPELTSLCSKIDTFPCPTIKHVLCQAEMAKRTLQLARSLLMLQPGENNANELLIYLINKLPLPEDYAQQELRPLMNASVDAF